MTTLFVALVIPLTGLLVYAAFRPSRSDNDDAPNDGSKL